MNYVNWISAILTSIMAAMYELEPLIKLCREREKIRYPIQRLSSAENCTALIVQMIMKVH